jgi:ATP-binding cassette subfamily C protein
MRQNRLLWTLLAAAAILAGFSNLVFAYSVRQTVDLATGSSARPFFLVCLICGLLLLATAAVNCLKDLLNAKMIQRINLRKRERLFGAAFQDEQKNTDFVSLLTNDMHTLETEFYRQIFDLILHLSTFVFAGGMLLFYNRLHGVLIIVLAMLSVAVTLLFKNRLGKKRMRISETQEKYVSRIKDMFYGLKEIRLFLALPKVKDEHRNVSGKLEEAKLRFAAWMAGMEFLSTVLTMFMFIFSFLLGGYFVTRGIYTLGMMMSAIQLVNNIVTPVSAGIQCVNRIHAALPVYQKLELLAEGADAEPESDEVGTKYTEIRITGMKFSYGNDFCLSIPQLSVEAGKKYALVGGSGGGKTTLFNLLVKNQDCSRGQVFYNGRDIRTLNRRQLLSSVALMNQNVFLFNDTIRNNITLFCETAKEEFDRAVKTAGLAEFLAGLPEKEYHEITNNGDNVSGGQKQRIALARVLLKGASIILLDEAFSSLDPQTAQGILRDILSLDLTCVATFHHYDSSVLMRFDEIIAMKNGQIAEQGKFDTLMEQKGYFFSLYHMSV